MIYTIEELKSRISPMQISMEIAQQVERFLVIAISGTVLSGRCQSGQSTSCPLICRCIQI